MARAKSTAANKKGHTESKAQLKRRQEMEEALMGNDDKITLIPKYLSKEEKIFYKFLIDELADSGVVSNADQPLLEQVATVLSVLRQADDEIRKNGILISSYDKYGNEKIVQNPALLIKKDMLTKYTSLCNQLPLSPSSRASLAAKKIEAKEEEQDKVLQLLRGGNGV